MRPILECRQVKILVAQASYKFKKFNRVKSARLFQTVYKHGTAFNDAEAVFYVFPSEDEKVKIGLAVGKKLGCAVERNHAKRLMREVFRHKKNELHKPVCIIWVVRRRLLHKGLAAYAKVFCRLAHKAALM